MELPKFAPTSTSEEEEMLKEHVEGERLPPEEEKEKEAPQEEPKPAGKLVRFSGEGNQKRSHYKAFEFAGNRYTIEDPVLLAPETKELKPDITIIKDITQTIDGMVIVTGQRLYRPEEAKKKGGGSWQIRDSRELFYSIHRVEVPAKCVMHKCVVYFVSVNKQLPDSRKHPGFIIQQVYDAEKQKLWKIIDKEYD
ncbi:unnamed protein product [Dovyalis caffra]|uniref:BAH domain-containing protein n=1 Tax=Dovyalis caffra TaxID=77055 RepID=A0AAV1RH47_9ROSI|nr:unnamed protein product [Dovyalis caffra]